MPEPTDEWYEVLLTQMIARESDRFDSTPDFRRELNRRLSVMHAVERRRVTFVEHKVLGKSLRNSESKLQATLDVFELEQENLRDDLRMVILTDYIRKEFLAPGSQDKKSRRLGAVPIFELIREKYGSTVPMALLTGSLIILPRALTDHFFRQVQKRDADIQRPRTIPLLSDADYVLLKLNQSIRQVAVGAVTDLFNAGDLRTIVGTIALLGEGWDAPATNTLVMASASSTYVQTNQVRGRAIRIDPNDPAKISSIWHLACIETTSPGGGSDFQKIRSRFSAFEGLSYKGDRILSGFQRLFSLPGQWSESEVERMNTVTRDLARDRQRIDEGWQRSLVRRATAQRSGLVEEVQAGSQSIMAMQIVRHPQRRSAIPAVALSAYAPVAVWMLPALELGLPQLAIIHGTLLAALTVGLRLPRLARDWWQVLSLGMGPVILGRVAEVLLMTLSETGMLKTPRKHLSLHYADAGNGKSTCCLQGGSLNESDLFIRCMEEVLDPVDNPRYLIFRPHPKRKKARKGEGDFHSVPSALARKEQANVLLRHWKKHIGPCELIFTRRKAGRKMLLMARARAWVSLHQKVTDRQSVWK